MIKVSRCAVAQSAERWRILQRFQSGATLLPTRRGFEPPERHGIFSLSLSRRSIRWQVNLQRKLSLPPHLASAELSARSGEKKFALPCNFYPTLSTRPGEETCKANDAVRPFQVRQASYNEDCILLRFFVVPACPRPVVDGFDQLLRFLCTAHSLTSAAVDKLSNINFLKKTQEC